MPKKIDPAVKERAVKLVLEHQVEYPSLYAAVSAVAKQQRLGVESLRRWVNQALACSPGSAMLRCGGRRLRRDLRVLLEAAGPSP
jgi:transposase-like protein